MTLATTLADTTRRLADTARHHGCRIDIAVRCADETVGDATDNGARPSSWGSASTLPVLIDAALLWEADALALEERPPDVDGLVSSIERVTGTSVADDVRRRVLRPSGATETVIEEADGRPSIIGPAADLLAVASVLLATRPGGPVSPQLAEVVCSRHAPGQHPPGERERTTFGLHHGLRDVTGSRGRTAGLGGPGAWVVIDRPQGLAVAVLAPPPGPAELAGRAVGALYGGLGLEDPARALAGPDGP